MTKLKSPTGIALDGSDNIYIPSASKSWITAYAAGSTGNVAPINEIKGKRTGLGEPFGVAIRQNDPARQSPEPKRACISFPVAVHAGVQLARRNR